MSIVNNIYVCNSNNMYDFFKNWHFMNNSYNIKFYDSEMCRDFILSNCGSLYCEVYDFLQDQSFKDFFWYLCVLYKKGGICVSSNITPLMPLKILIEEKTELVLCMNHENEKLMFNSEIMASKKNNIIVRSCIMWYVTRYQNDKIYSYENYDYCKCINSCIVMDKENICLMDNIKVQLLKKKETNIIYNGVVFFNSHASNFNFMTIKTLKLCVIMFYEEDQSSYAKVIHEINKKYCENHNIDIFITNEKHTTTKHSSMEIIALALQKIQQYDYVILLSSDCMFYCPGKNILSIIESNNQYDIIISQKDEKVTTNVLIVKNTDYSFNFLTKLFSYDDSLTLKETFDEYYKECDQIKKYVFGYIYSYSEKDTKYSPFILDTSLFDIVKRNKLVRRHYTYYFDITFDENLLNA